MRPPARIPSRNTRDDRFMLDQLLEVEEGLTEWECDFVEDLARQDRVGEIFTPAQRAKLTQIYDDRCT